MKALLSKFASKSFGCFVLVLLGTQAVFGQSDLQLLSVEFTPSTVKAGGTITEVSWFLLNNGPQTLARPTFTFDFFLSRNTAIGDADDVKIDSASIPNPTVNWPAGSGSQQKIFEIAVPGDASGDYYVVVRVNPLGTDPNLANNSTRSLNPIRVVALPIITVQPINRSVGEGQTATFSVVAEGSGPLNYQWQRDRLPLAGQTNSNLVLLNVRTNDAGVYRVTVSNVAGVVNSRDTIFAVIPTDLTFRLINPTKVGNAFAVTVFTITNRTYVLQYTDTLRNRVWTAITALSGNGT
ncbi:MAG: immunoglobulin domain-containing protein, partial [Bacteroidota bacterium]